MKDISTIAGNYHPTKQQQSKHALSDNINDQVRELVDSVFIQLGSIFPAWKSAWRGKSDQETARNISLVKREWVKSFYENNINSVELVRNGLVMARKSDSDFIPSCGKFVKWCQQPEDASESFDRFIDRKEPIDYAELLTRRKVGFQCRTQLPEDKARKLWAETISKIRVKIANGEITTPDPTAERIETPEKMKETLTTEQRNQQLDRRIDEFISRGIKLIGPYKARFEER
jgi:hypothetical protein